jgi:hypothetical protein
MVQAKSEGSSHQEEVQKCKREIEQLKKELQQSKQAVILRDGALANLREKKNQVRARDR